MSNQNIIINKDSAITFKIEGLNFVPISSSESFLEKTTGLITNTITNISSTKIDNLLCIQSLPISEPYSLGIKLMNDTSLIQSNLYELGNNCATILQGIYLGALFNKSYNHTSLLFTADNFADFKDCGNSIKSFQEWKSMSSTIVISSSGILNVEILSYVSTIQSQFYDMISFYKNPFYVSLNEKDLLKFNEIDLYTEINTINKALSVASLSIEDIQHVIVTNREEKRTKILAQKLGGNISIINSRNNIGHTGGSDILYNIQQVLSDLGKKSQYYIISANGLGYIWSSMILKINKI